MSLLKIRFPSDSLLVLVTSYMIHSLIGPYFVLVASRLQYQAFAAPSMNTVSFAHNDFLISLCAQHSHQFGSHPATCHDRCRSWKHTCMCPSTGSHGLVSTRASSFLSGRENNSSYPAIAVATNLSHTARWSTDHRYAATLGDREVGYSASTFICCTFHEMFNDRCSVCSNLPLPRPKER